MKTHEKKIDLTKTESVEWDFEMDFASSTVPAVLTYTDDFDGWMKRVPEGYSSHPEIPVLTLKKFKGTRLEGGMIKVTLNYECSDPSAEFGFRGKGPIKRYNLEPSSGEEPLLTFHKLDEVSDDIKEALGELVASSRKREDFAKALAAISAGGPPEPLALLAIEKIRKGIEGYRHAGIMWVERFMTTNINDMDCAKFFTIQTPPGNPPELVGGANWLYVPGTADVQSNGRSWEMERRWEASLKGGWDDWLYAAETTPDP